MRPEDVYQLTGASDPRLRPGGEEIAYVVWAIDGDENEYRQSIWLARTDGSQPPRRFTTGKNDAQPRWSPDGTKLGFVSKRGSDEKAHRQLYVMPAGGGERPRVEAGAQFLQCWNGLATDLLHRSFQRAGKLFVADNAGVLFRQRRPMTAHDLKVSIAYHPEFPFDDGGGVGSRSGGGSSG